MRRPGAWWLMLVGVACCGCKQVPLTQGNLLGRTTVPPPGTGEAMPGAAAPYYQAPGAAGPPAASTAPPYEPPGGYDHSALPPTSQGAMAPMDSNGLRWVQSQDGGRNEATAPQVARTGERTTNAYSPPDEAPVVGRLQIGGRRAESSAVPADAMEFVQQTEATALRILEPAQDADGPTERVRLAAGRQMAAVDRWREEVTASSGARRVAHWEAEGDAADVRLATASARRAGGVGAFRSSARATRGGRAAPYGHDPSYTWLKGQLQRTDDNRQWMLRYVPPGRSEDAYGGVVALPDSAVMAGYTAGDYVAVQGELLADHRGASAYPSYDIQRIKPLGRF